MLRNRIVETDRFTATSGEGKKFVVVEMTTQEVSPGSDARAEDWRPIGKTYRTSAGVPVETEADGSFTVTGRASTSVKRVSN
jgi:hypothetical protein